MVDKATLLDLLIFVARIVFYTVIIVVVVLAVDVVALWLLNLPMDVDMWSALLLWEGFILMVVGAGGWGLGEHKFGPIAGWKRPRIYHVILRPKYPGFWFSVAMAGVVLFVSSVYTISILAVPTIPAGTIYVRPDGRVAPKTALIQRDGNIYTFTSNINASIVVERDNIVIDGAGYTLQGTGRETGIVLSDRSNVTIKNMKIKAFYTGICLTRSSDTRICGNNITNNDDCGIWLWHSSNNTIYHNNFINNVDRHAIVSIEPGYGSPNTWDDGYPSGGNYWSDYENRYPEAEELDGSGIWNTPYVIDENNQDNYPLVDPC